MELVKLTHENIDQEHICCAISGDRDIQVISKKNWLKERLDEGLVFLKGNVRGKCFIEYIPAEYAWAPIRADEYMYINCLWVSGRFKGHGYADLLLDTCIQDSRAKGKKGLVILSSGKKRGFLSDPAYMKHRGFQTADTAEPYFELLFLPFEEGAGIPRFRDTVREHSDMQKGFVLYYTSQCPFTAKYVPVLERMAEDADAAFRSIHIRTAEDAQNAPSPFTTFSLFHDGRFVTHEILSEKKFDKILADRGR